MQALERAVGLRSFLGYRGIPALLVKVQRAIPFAVRVPIQYGPLRIYIRKVHVAQDLVPSWATTWHQPLAIAAIADLLGLALIQVLHLI